jgi:hypothetical protein
LHTGSVIRLGYSTQNLKLPASTNVMVEAKGKEHALASMGVEIG